MVLRVRDPFTILVACKHLLEIFVIGASFSL
ncbi:hypothetical protein J2776_002927 [Paraburkholderia caledonica]|uniref:Uncharacterized protein n=1 Tax=Paraburkholderia caledonica TaxID=134536 RepID=A0ABU1KZ98_9BURK|nr:hypothetical protein [Paraburkholderia caledonica]